MSATVQEWLTIQCQMIAGVKAGMVVFANEKHIAPGSAATWPNQSSESSEMSSVCCRAISKQEVIVENVTQSANPGRPEIRLACPILVNGQLLGAVAVNLIDQNASQQQAAINLLKWGSSWLQLVLTQQKATSKPKLSNPLELIAICLEHEHFYAAATAVMTELATRLKCERVSIGFQYGHHIKVYAISHSAKFKPQSNLIQDIAAAMEEAVEQKSIIVLPNCYEDRIQITNAHSKLAEQHDSKTICTVPLSDKYDIHGALTFELLPGQSLDTQDAAQIEQVTMLIGPLLEMKREKDRWLILKITDSIKRNTKKLTGTGHNVLKLGVGLTLAISIFLWITIGEYRVTATSTLEGAVQRAIVAPIDGFISTASYGPGDIVHQDNIIATLDTKDLNLEFMKWSTQRKQLQKENRSAMAGHDHAQRLILKAKIFQAQAQITLIQEQLARTKMVAPFNGIIVSGDLRQSLGSPVERGQILFEVAPLNAYRLILKVDERDIAQIVVKQEGELVLTSIPHEIFKFEVIKITPVSTINEGRNFFQVEANLLQTSEKLRPGMEGIAKVKVGERKLMWIWTHRLIDWLHLQLWGWW